MSQCWSPSSPEALITSENTVRPKSLYYGWVMLPLSMGALIASSPGQTFGVSIFNEPMRLSLGVSQGLFFAAAHPLWARYFGRRHLGRIRGVLMTIQVGASSIGPLMAGLMRDYFGDFGWALTVFAVAPLPIAVLSLWAAPPCWPKVESLEPELCTAQSG